MKVGSVPVTLEASFCPRPVTRPSLVLLSSLLSCLAIFVPFLLTGTHGSLIRSLYKDKTDKSHEVQHWVHL